jgi:hypothetical protein
MPFSRLERLLHWWKWRNEPPREGWVVMVDASGREVTPRIPVVVKGDPLVFKVDHSLTFEALETTVIHAARVIDADGNTYDVPINP